MDSNKSKGRGKLSRSKKILIGAGIFFGLAAIGAATDDQSKSQQPPAQQTQTAQTIQIQEESPVPEQEVKTEKKTEKVGFKTSYVNDSGLAKGKTLVKQSGKNGVKTLTYEVTYTNGKETGRKLVSEKVTTEPQDKIVARGTYVVANPSTPKCDPNYTGGCVPIVSYDLDCSDVGFSVVVVGYDKHNFDGNNDGYGCEAY